MNWDDLRIFLALSRDKRVSKASDRLSMVPTTLIRRVKRLEDSLNCSLFELTTKGYMLTSHGTRLVEYIDKAEHSILEAKSDLRNERAELSGTIRVSTAEGFGTWFLAPLLPVFKSLYPGITVELVSSSGFLNVSRREADIAILLERPSRGLLYIQKLTDYMLKLYIHKEVFKANKNAIAANEFDEINLITYVEDMIYSPQLKFIEESKLTNMKMLRSTSISAQYMMLKNKAGAGILPLFMAEKDEELISFLEEDINIKRSFWLATHRDVRHLAKMNVFVEWLKTQIQNHKNRFVQV